MHLTNSYFIFLYLGTKTSFLAHYCRNVSAIFDEYAIIKFINLLSYSKVCSQQ